MEREPDAEWCMWMSLGDVMVRSGRYGEAKTYYRKALETQQPPRFVDSLESIAQVCELEGDLAGAVGALEEEIALLAAEWDTASGETVDAVRREISRLKAKRN